MKFRLEKKGVTEKEDCKTIEAQYDSSKEWRMDPAGYFLIRVNPETKKLECGLCKKDNIVEVKVVGESAEEIVNTICREKISEDVTHLAYLGAELARAEVARELGIQYVQDDLLDLSEVQAWNSHNSKD